MSSENPARGGGSFLWLMSTLAFGAALLGITHMPDQSAHKEASQTDKEEKKSETADESDRVDPIAVLREYLRFSGREPRSTFQHRFEGKLESGGSTTTATLETRRESPKDAPKLETSLSSMPAQYEFLIATVPDPIESKFPHEFDAVLEGIQQAFAARDFTLRLSRLPWRRGRSKGTEQSASASPHREHPGVLVFRKNPQRVEGQEQDCIAVVCLVGESPITGLHKPALTKALDARKQLNDVFNKLANEIRWTNQSKSIQLVAPFFTGSQTSLVETLRQWKSQSKEAVQFRIINGSASELRPGVFADHGRSPDASMTLETTVIPHDLVVRGILQYLTGDLSTKLDSRVKKITHRVAILREANTGFGAQTAQYGKNTLFGDYLSDDVIDLPFPSSISQLAAEQDRNTKPLLPHTDFVEPKILQVPDATQLDAIPPYDPQAAAAMAGERLRAIMDTIERARVRYVGIVATDARDVVYLTRLLQKQCPNARVFTTEPSSVLMNPDDAVYLRGMVVGSTYPLEPSTQYWGMTQASPVRMIPFSTQGSQGYFNAIVAQFDRPDLMLGYHPPKPPQSAEHPEALARPPVWISIVGNGGRFVPVHCYSDFGTFYKDVDETHPKIYQAGVTEAVRDVHPEVNPGDPDRKVSSPMSLPKFGISVGLLLGALGAVLSLAAVIVTLAVPRAWEKWAFGPPKEMAPSRKTDSRSSPAAAANSSESESVWLWVWRSVLLAGILLFALPYALPIMEVLPGSYTGVPEGARGWRHWVILGAAIFVAAEVIAVLAFLIRRAVRGTLATPSESRWGPGALAAIVLVGASAMFIWSIEKPPIERFFLYVRTTDFSSGLSPLAPMMLLGAATFAIGFCGLRQSVTAGRIQLNRPYDECWDSIQEADQELQRNLNEPLSFLANLRTGGVALIIGVPLLLSFFWNYVVVPLPSGEGRPWDWIVATVFWAAILAVANSLARFLMFWSRLGKLMKEILNVPMVRAFERLPDEVRRLFGGYLHSTEQLRHTQLSALAWALPPGKERDGLKVISNADNPALLASFGKGESSSAEFYCRKAKNYLEDVRQAWPAKSVDEAFGTIHGHEKDGADKVAKGGAVHSSSRVAEDEATSTAAELDRQQAIDAKELFVACYVSLYLGPYFAHLRMLAHSMIWPAVLLLLAAASYPLQPERPLLNVLVGLLAAIAAAIVYVLYRINRDGLVSRIMRTVPDRFTPDSGFMRSMLTYVAPVVTIVALQILGLFRFIVEPILNLFQ